MYPLNWPFSHLVGSLGVPLKIKIIAFHDKEAGVYVASSPNVKGLNLEAESLDELRREINLTVPELLEINHQMTLREIEDHPPQINICTPLQAA